MELVVLVTDLLGTETLLHRLGLCLSPILIRAAHIEHVVTPEPGKPGVYISREDAANNIAQVRDIVDIRKGGRNHDVSFPVFW